MIKNMFALCKQWRVALFILSAGTQTGVYAAWTGLFDQILGPTGWSDTEVSVSV